MRFLTFLVILVFLAINIFLYIDLKKTQARVSAQIAGLKKISACYQEKREQHELQKETAKIRGLEFLKPVTYRTMVKEEVMDLIQEKIEEELTVLGEKILRKFGFLRPGEEVLSHITRLYGEQVQGMYDEETGEMVLVKGLPLTGNLQRMFLVHELTHALQDQHFSLKTLPLNSDNDDRALACLSLIEGDATLVMFEYYKNHLRILNIFWDLLSYLSVDQSELYSSPYYIRENLIFPYKWGIKFVAGRSWEGINKVYKSPPESTEQMMHPEKYLLDKPIELTISETIPQWKMLDTNTMGEFNIMVLLSIYLGEYESVVPSSGWGGDKWQVWEEPSTGKLKVIWYTVWDVPKDADEFFNAFKRFVRRRYPDIPSARISKKGNQVRLYW